MKNTNTTLINKDFNNVKTQGIYRFNGVNQNVPFSEYSYGIMFVFGYTGYIIQLAFTITNNSEFVLYVRPIINDALQKWTKIG